MEWKTFAKNLRTKAKKAAKKTGEATDIAVKYVRLHKMDSKLSDRYEALGRLTYKQLKTGESQAEKIALYIESIDKIRADRKALNAEIEADRARFEGEDKEAEEVALEQEKKDEEKDGE